MEEGGQLLPGIPNQITLAHVVTKLPWTTFHILSSTSRVWQRAIQSHQVYDARIWSQSAQTLVAINHRRLNLNAIALYSVKDDSYYHLPPIPGLDRGVPWSCQCVSLDGRLYILGGLKESMASESQDLASADVYVLDLAVRRQWKQCASMQDPRQKFGCGVVGGKIYVFAGVCQRQPLLGCEVYDPKEDAWSRITPGSSFRVNHKVVAVGEELFVHSGSIPVNWVIDPSGGYSRDKMLKRFQNESFERLCHPTTIAWHSHAYSAQVYNPIRDDWRSIEHFTDPSEMVEIVLTIKGNLHKVNRDGIQVYDFGAMSWKPFKKFWYSSDGPLSFFIRIHPLIAVPVDEELLTIGFQSNVRQRSMPLFLEKTQGLGCENKEIVWEYIRCPLSLANPLSPFMCSIQL